MLHRLILKVTKFQLTPPKRLSTVVKNILGDHHSPPNRVKAVAHLIEVLLRLVVANQNGDCHGHA